MPGFHNRIFFFLIAILLSFTQHLALGQDSLVTKHSQSPNYAKALANLEARTGYQFFYLDDWLPKEEAPTISGLPLVEALDLLLSATTLNYYILEEEKRVFLLRNSVVYDVLPEGFFGIPADSAVADAFVAEPSPNPQPVFYSEDIRATARKYPIVRIGKANPTSTQAEYQLSGTVRRLKNGEPIADLPIRNTQGRLLAVTDAQGRYSVSLEPGYHILVASAMGIREMKRELFLYNNGVLDLSMEEDIQVLEEVVVAANAEQNVVAAVTGGQQIDSEESKSIPIVLGERDILQVAKALPGISSAGEGATGLNVRGGKTDQNLILLDDAVIYNPSHFFGIFQALNPFTTEGVDIYKGSIPVEHGGRLSSVLDIRSKNGSVDDVKAEGSIGPVTANLALELPVKKDTSSLVIGGRGAYADWILRSLDEESLNNSEASFYDGIVKYHQRFGDNSELRATGYFSRDKFSITSDSLFQYSNALASVRWDHSWNANTQGALIMSYSDYRFGVDFEGESNQNFDLDYEINETQLKYKLNTRLNEKHTLSYGIATKLYSVNPGSIAPLNSGSDIDPFEIDREKALEGALFLGDLFRVSKNWLLDIGGRYTFYAALGPGNQNQYAAGQPKSASTRVETTNYDSGEFIETYGGPELRFSARYLIDNSFSIKGSFNTAYQFIHTLTNNTTASPIDTWKLSDLNIEPQTGWQASLGFYKNLDENNIEISLEGYYKQMDNVLDFKTGADLLLNETIETEVLQGDGKAYGIEFLIKKNRGDLNGWLAYTYSRSFYRFDSAFPEERVNDGDYFPSNFDKPHDVSLILNYKFTRRYSASMNFVYQTGRPVTYPVGTFRFNNADFVVFSDRNEFRIPDYYRLDLGINIEGNHRKNKLAHSFWTISVYNVLGRNNPYSVFFVTDQGEVKALQSSIFSIPVPSITYNFKF
ncbi:MAG: TonB-dependent receptor [Eudoraea sp.]|nr:TonB-dependent receptor [Eudoraea sp.]NNK30075.1 TonB-dependent receptor [Flavobacteriaceae bacterium]